MGNESALLQLKQTIINKHLWGK